MTEPFIGLFGIFCGFILSELGIFLREKRTELKVAKSCRTIISAEIDLNMELLKTVWQQVKLAIPDGQEIQDEEIKRERKNIAFAKRFSEIPISECREVFVSQLPLIAKSLDHHEIKKVFHFYATLRRLDVIRKELASAWEKQETEEHTGINLYVSDSSHPYFPPIFFKEKVIEVWDDCERLMVQSIRDNPLKP